MGQRFGGREGIEGGGKASLLSIQYPIMAPYIVSKLCFRGIQLLLKAGDGHLSLVKLRLQTTALTTTSLHVVHQLHIIEREVLG